MTVVDGTCFDGLLGLLELVLDDTWKMALYDLDADLGPNTDGYVKDAELPAAGGYPEGGFTLAPKAGLTEGGLVWLNFADMVIPTTSISARYGLIYNATRELAFRVVDFGKVVSSTDGNFYLTFPPDGAEATLVLET